MYNFIYSRPLWLVGFCLLFLAVVWSRADEWCAVSHRRTVAWKLLNFMLLLVSILFIAWVTLLRREPMAEPVVELRPFATFERIAGEREYIRTMVMNAALFLPLGLSAAALLPRRWPWLRMAAALLLGLAVSCGVEQLQYLHLLGTVEVDDVLCNTFGALLGGQFVLIVPLTRKLLRP
ncbi:MAG: VanZ family protein [Oscillospiraceae bacterium]|nr:VanZ family protein [Oscillospiraceae bacterium]